jgi:hypothetical protein
VTLLQYKDCGSTEFLVASILIVVIYATGSPGGPQFGGRGGSRLYYETMQVAEILRASSSSAEE